MCVLGDEGGEDGHGQGPCSIKRAKSIKSGVPVCALAVYSLLAGCSPGLCLCTHVPCGSLLRLESLARWIVSRFAVRLEDSEKKCKDMIPGSGHQWSSLCPKGSQFIQK